MHNPCGGRPRRDPPKAGGGAESAPPAAGEAPPISAGRLPAKGRRAQKSGRTDFSNYCGSGRSPNSRARRAAKSSATATAPASSSSPSGVQPARMPMQGTPFAVAP